ncbi:diacylglycerol kinase family protein [Kitasatospora sp. NBC_00240]|uniref:diacylglycerol kinase family protein n=1 Tax=Kitasatospora sp. NBC_00240 TaxID=2903567 RepID=UPI00224DF1B7|nr:diacylglycerol kinase family protein [Kitasatospora sp. NBC_00240]MCX5208519.1 diacylglycerol kinase family protein [Kitasatospora sp. NBC_00240]
MTTGVNHLLRRIAPPLLLQTLLMVLVGLTITHPPLHLWRPGENAVTDRLAANRVPVLDTVTSWLSVLAGTGAVVTVAAVAVLALLLRAGWREAAFLGGAVAAQSAVFLLVTMGVDRPRPTAPQLDAAPPTSSFPSGHVGAAVALYGALAVLAALRLRGPLRLPLCALAAVLPVLVAAGRLYRGMHHPSDVLAGLVNGVVVLLVMWRAFLGDRGRSTAAAGPRRPPGGRSVVVVFNPLLVDVDTLDRIGRVLAEHGCPAPVHAATSAEDPGRGAAARAVEAGADLVVACGGDGTVTACAHALAGTGVALAIVPCGTGNLLARNLGLPSDPARALAEALGGEPRWIDLALADGDGISPTTVSAMAGIGLDAATMADTHRSAKDRYGWPAYLPPLVRHLRDRRMRLTVTLDEAPPVHRRAAMAVVGNVGALQGGIRLLPDARPDDGVLDLVLVHPRGLTGWPEAAARLLTGRVRGGSADQEAPFEHFRARRILITADRDQPRELDGESLPAGRTLRLDVRPAALLVHVPPAAERHRVGSGTVRAEGGN